MVRNVGKSLGLEFSTTRERFASTLKGHALLEFAKESAEEKQDSVAEKLFKVPACCCVPILITTFPPNLS